MLLVVSNCSRTYFWAMQSLIAIQKTNLIICFIIVNAMPLWFWNLDNVSVNKWKINVENSPVSLPSIPSWFFKIIFCIHIEKWKLFSCPNFFTFNCPFNWNNRYYIFVIEMSEWESMVIWLSRFLKKRDFSYHSNKMARYGSFLIFRSLNEHRSLQSSK